MPRVPNTYVTMRHPQPDEETQIPKDHDAITQRRQRADTSPHKAMHGFSHRWNPEKLYHHGQTTNRARDNLQAAHLSQLERDRQQSLYHGHDSGYGQLLSLAQRRVQRVVYQRDTTRGLSPISFPIFGSQEIRKAPIKRAHKGCLVGLQFTAGSLECSEGREDAMKCGLQR